MAKSNELPERMWPRGCFYENGRWYTDTHGTKVAFMTAKSAKAEQDLQAMLQREASDGDTH